MFMLVLYNKLDCVKLNCVLKKNIKKNVKIIKLLLDNIIIICYYHHKMMFDIYFFDGKKKNKNIKKIKYFINFYLTNKNKCDNISLLS